MASLLDPDTVWTNTAPDDSEEAVLYGDPATVAPLLLADAYALEVLYGAHPPTTLLCETDTTGDTLAIWVPPFVDRVRVAAIGTGEGTVTIDGTYDIPIASGDPALLDAIYGDPFDGPAGASDEIALSPATLGVPWLWEFTVARSADCRLYELRFEWGRSTSAL